MSEFGFVEQRVIKGKNGGSLHPQMKGKPAPPGAGRPKNVFKHLIQEMAEIPSKVHFHGNLVVDGVETGEKVIVSVKMSAAGNVVAKMYQKASKGDVHAAKWLAETGFGKNASHLVIDDETSAGSGGFVLVMPDNRRNGSKK